jgi:hypothetical protein
MQTIGSVTLFAAGLAAVTTLSVALYAALPKAVLAYAERHGRFQGLRVRELGASGTRADVPPARQIGMAEGVAG